MVTRWSRVAFGGALLLLVVGALLYGVSILAGVAVHVVAALFLLVGYRVRKSGPGWVDMADSM